MNKGARPNLFRSFLAFWRALWNPIGIARRPSQQNRFVAYWRAFLLLPIIPWIIQFLLFVLFWFCTSSHALAQDLHWDEALPYQYHGGSHQKSYCLFTYDVLGPDDDIYTCKQVRVHIVSLSSGPNYDPVVDGRYHCWSYRYSNWYGGYGGASGGTWDGIILNTKLQFSMSPPQYNPSAPCIKKRDADPPLICDINLRSIITGAFSNKFPLDLFTGFNPDTPPVAACPSFTIEGQTFQLCYINRLTATLKYVLLLVFVISSVIAL
jgi:hypothetical protein